MKKTGQGFPTWGLRNSLVSTGPGRKLPGWTARNCGEGTPSGLTVRPGAVGRVRASPGRLCRPTRTQHSASPSALRSQWWPGQPPSEGDTLGDSKACAATASARGLGMGTPPGHEPTQGCPGLWRAGPTPPLSPRTQPHRLQPCARHTQKVPAWPSPPGDRPQVLARRVLVQGSVTVLCLRQQDLAHHPR